jgi:hypothetical protein
MGVNVELLDQIDRLVDGLCPCGAEPRDGSAYCSYDCEPNHVSVHTDQREFGEYATPMRWRPDLVTGVDDTGLDPVEPPAGMENFGYDGVHNVTLFRRAGTSRWHLRLDDGHRFVGADIDPAGSPDEVQRQVSGTWERLERELGNSRHVEVDPWADALGDDEDWRLTDAEMLLVSNPSFPSWLSGAVDNATAHYYAERLARSGGVDPRLSGSVFVASPEADRGPVTMTPDNRYGAFRLSRADGGLITHYEIELDAPEGVPLLDALVVAQSGAALRERARLLAEQSPGLAFSRLGERIGDALEELGRTMRPAFEAFNRDAARRFPQPHPEPDTPMLAAIEARRNRNTGPEQRQRAPRQINPRRR